MIIPSRALGRAGNVPPSDRIAIGCIGVGSMGTSNMWSFFGKPEAQIVALCDVDAKHRDDVRKEIEKQGGDKGLPVYGDFRELLARRDLDAVSIAVPDHWHALIAVAAARRGVDIYGEKPLAYTIAEGRAIVDAVATVQHRLANRELAAFGQELPARLRACEERENRKGAHGARGSPLRVQRWGSGGIRSFDPAPDVRLRHVARTCSLSFRMPPTAVTGTSGGSAITREGS